MNDEIPCPLCAGAELSAYFEDARRCYLQCGDCALVFVAEQYHLSLAQEKAEYDLHENNVDDPGYRRFLSRLALPLMERLAPGASGLDFGCGPGPALADILCRSGFQLSLYDPFYAPDSSVMDRPYDFICATEVVEHLKRPGMELARLWSLLEPGGCLAIMTKLVRDRAAFAHWHYKNDPTHICFFSEQTWHWWARHQGASLEIIGADVVLLEKNG